MTYKQLIAVATLTAALLSFIGAAQADSGKITNPDNNHSYQRFDTLVTWEAARTACASLSGHLATSTSASENTWINTNMASGIAVWLGGTDAAKEGTWQWLTGEAWSYQNWASGEPNNAGGGENFLMMNFPGKTAGSWNDYGGPGNNSTKTVAYLCEWDSPYTCDKDCPAPFVKNEFWTTKYGPAAANIVLSKSNFLACSSPSYALCYYSGPPSSDPNVQSLPCTVSPTDPSVADCRCPVESGASYVDINSIRNTEAYIETIRTCGITGALCKNMENEKSGTALLTAPVCDYLQASANGTPMEPKSEVISTFSTVQISGYHLGQTDCATPATYAGCMTASCTYELDANNNKTGFAQCKCPLYTGPYQVGQNRASCDAGSGYVWSAAFAPNPVQLSAPTPKNK